MRSALIAISGVFFGISSLFGKTADELKNELQAICPNGMKVRCVWSQGPSSNDRSVYKVDSDDGIIEELTPSNLFDGSRIIGSPFLTRDGQKVAFTNEASQILYVIDWDGSNLTQIAEADIGATWQDPADGSQWVMAAVNGTSLIKISNPNETRQVWQEGVDDVGDTDGLGLSVDGLKFGAFLCGSNSGIGSVPDGNPTCNQCGGCNFTMRPTSGGVYQYTHFPSGHATIHIHNDDASLVEDADISSTVNIGGDEATMLHYANDPDFVLFHKSGASKNPIMFQLSTKNWVAMYDNPSEEVCHLDAVFYSPSSNAKPAVAAVAQRRMQGSGNQFYAIDGRRIAHPSSTAGIVIHAETGKIILPAKSASMNRNARQ